MLLATFHRVFRPVTAPIDSERSRERDPLAMLSVRPSLCERDRDDTNSDRERSLNSGDLHIDGVRVSLDSDNTPLLARKHSSQPSTSTTTTTTVTASGEILHAGPSHVYWKTPHSGSAVVLGSQRPSCEAGPANSNSVDYASMHSHTPTSPVLWGSHSISRSVSSPSLLSPPSNASGMREYKPSSLGRQSSRSLRLPRDSLSASEDSDAESTRSLREHPTLPKQLSPIHEQQVPFPPHRKLSTDSVRTPDSTRTFDRITTHSTHSAFINRPLKRSLSQTSTSTHLSALSTPAPPVIPPLDLRPNFQAAMGVPQGRQSPITLQAPTPRKSRLPVPTLPTVIGSPRQTNMVSVIYEDGASASASARSSTYATAPASPSTPTAERGERLSQSLHGLADLFVDPDDIVTNPSRGSADTTGTVTTHATQRALPSSVSGPASPRSDGERADSDTRPSSRTVPRPQNPVPPSTHSHLGTPRNSASGARLLPHPPSPNSLSSDGSESSFLAHWDQRWLKGMSFGSGRFAHPPPAHMTRKREVTHAFVLFWAGFVAPWCWLIGGWLLSREGEAFEPEGPLLPLWHRRRADRGKHVAVDRGDAYGDSDHQHARGVSCGGGAHEFRGAAEHKRMKGTSWYPLIAPSVESLAPSIRSHGSAHKVRRHLHGHGSRGVDPWIARCRVAAAVSGVLIFAGFIVAMVFVGIHA